MSRNGDFPQQPCLLFRKTEKLVQICTFYILAMMWEVAVCSLVNFRSQMVTVDLTQMSTVRDYEVIKCIIFGLRSKSYTLGNF